MLVSGHGGIDNTCDFVYAIMSTRARQSLVVGAYTQKSDGTNL